MEPACEASSGEGTNENITINSLMQSATNELKSDPTHYSKLDVKKMKVDELRTELAARNLDTKGLKQQLLNRLKEAIQDEKVIFRLICIILSKFAKKC